MFNVNEVKYNKSEKMDESMLGLIANGSGVELDIREGYCPFTNTCRISNELCSTEDYEECNFYSARLYEVLNTWRRNIKDEMEMEKLIGA